MKKWPRASSSTGDTEPESRAPAKCPHSWIVEALTNAAITAFATAAKPAMPQPGAWAQVSAAPHIVSAPITIAKCQHQADVFVDVDHEGTGLHILHSNPPRAEKLRCDRRISGNTSQENG